MIVYIRQGIFLKLAAIPSPLLDNIKSTLTIENPAYEKARSFATRLHPRESRPVDGK